jgi:predicted nucleic acid-binding protein
VSRCRYVIDSSAWIEYLEGTKQGLAVKEIIEDTVNEIYTPAIIAAEVLSKSLRSGNKNIYENTEKTLEQIPRIIEIDYRIAKRAAEIHVYERKRQKDFGLADAFLAASAESIEAKIVTGDPHFKGMKNVVLIR